MSRGPAVYALVFLLAVGAGTMPLFLTSPFQVLTFFMVAGMFLLVAVREGRAE